MFDKLNTSIPSVILLIFFQNAEWDYEESNKKNKEIFFGGVRRVKRK